MVLQNVHCLSSSGNSSNASLSASVTPCKHKPQFSLPFQVFVQVQSKLSWCAGKAKQLQLVVWLFLLLLFSAGKAALTKTTRNQEVLSKYDDPVNFSKVVLDKYKNYACPFLFSLFLIFTSVPRKYSPTARAASSFSSHYRTLPSNPHESWPLS